MISAGGETIADEILKTNMYREVKRIITDNDPRIMQGIAIGIISWLADQTKKEAPNGKGLVMAIDLIDDTCYELKEFKKILRHN